MCEVNTVPEQETPALGAHPFLTKAPFPQELVCDYSFISKLHKLQHKLKLFFSYQCGSSELCQLRIQASSITLVR